MENNKIDLTPFQSETAASEILNNYGVAKFAQFKGRLWTGRITVKNYTGKANVVSLLTRADLPEFLAYHVLSVTTIEDADALAESMGYGGQNVYAAAVKQNNIARFYSPQATLFLCLLSDSDAGAKLRDRLAIPQDWTGRLGFRNLVPMLETLEGFHPVQVQEQPKQSSKKSPKQVVADPPQKVVVAEKPTVQKISTEIARRESRRTVLQGQLDVTNAEIERLKAAKTAIEQADLAIENITPMFQD